MSNGGVRLRRITLLFAIAAAVAIPVLITGYNLYQIDVVLLAVVGAVALNILTGNAGQVSLGNAAFLGIGAFTAVVAGTNFHLPFFAVLAAALTVSGIIGLVVGFPALRLRGMYLLLATLAIHYIFFFVATLYQTHTTGPAGFTIPAADIAFWHPANNRDWYVVLVILCAIVLFVADNLLRTRAGRAWALIKHKEPVADALGIPVAQYKVLAFVVSAMLIGLQGAVGAYFVGNVSVEQWDLNVAISYVAMIVLGGLGSITGSVVGAAIVTLLPPAIANFLSTNHAVPAQLASSAGPITTALYGFLIVATLLLAPRGIIGVIQAPFIRGTLRSE